MPYSNKAVLENGSTLIPLRDIFTSFGAEVIWNQKDKTIFAKRGSQDVLLKIGSKTAKSGDFTMTLPVAPKIKDGVTLVPLRIVSDSLGIGTRWRPDTKTIVLGNGQGDIMGNVTYNGVSADSGAEIFLINDSFFYTNYSTEKLKKFVTVGEFPNYSGLYHTTVDTSGKYTFKNVPLAHYRIIISSAHSTRNANDSISASVEGPLKLRLGEETYSIFAREKLLNNNFYFGKISVKHMQEVNLDYNFSD
ncbi:copper amine oxidase N-terminal domain-containing protein [Bacillus infantis]|uniref:copper amine oxidase N-terminal domain-containing protein n=1 Tax=Bacillus infantis TaxID=324767 RepID=UPI0021550A1A|nr:copper amine oxidase N-terminal domain-containing protein [Bacillus infantis]